MTALIPMRLVTIVAESVLEASLVTAVLAAGRDRLHGRAGHGRRVAGAALHDAGGRERPHRGAGPARARGGR